MLFACACDVGGESDYSKVIELFPSPEWIGLLIILVSQDGYGGSGDKETTAHLAAISSECLQSLLTF